ncbi:MAG: hypothetical protein HKN88_10070 [Gammaproteobacteria bacterium]|nr:hypothetical protein [Gammaproteobacteria bacterium]NNC98402.1 hypothetical protein [Gammaproteobacteria bacterium]NNM13070.1 hypothetical protein [Gammaproteobacteria bacterium]
MEDDLISNIKSKIKGLFSKARYDDDDVPEFKDEYSLLVDNKRVIDYTLINNKLGIKLQVGLYRDTNKFLTKGVSKEQAIENIGAALSAVKPVYIALLKEKFNKASNDFENETNLVKKFERTSRLFKIKGLQLANGDTEAVLCLHLLIRPDVAPFIIIGKQPKGKKREAIKDDVTFEETQDWDLVDFD